MEAGNYVQKLLNTVEGLVGRVDKLEEMVAKLLTQQTEQTNKLDQLMLRAPETTKKTKSSGTKSVSTSKSESGVPKKSTMPSNSMYYMKMLFKTDKDAALKKYLKESQVNKLKTFSESEEAKSKSGDAYTETLFKHLWNTILKDDEDGKNIKARIKTDYDSYKNEENKNNLTQAKKNEGETPTKKETPSKKKKEDEDVEEKKEKKKETKKKETKKKAPKKKQESDSDSDKEENILSESD